MYWILTLLALLFALPTYGISLLLHIMLIMTFKDKTTNTEVRYHIKKAFTKGKIIDTNKIEWEVALQYAQKEGKELTTIDNMISFYIFCKKEKTYVLIAPISSGGVSISAYNGRTQKEISSSLYPY
ncbi:MAG: hypothetical protein KAH67_06300 [Flavobacteriaceae bacterium]|nr:hypothetical protein [Flavobacteriaceae bacterium]